MVILQYVEGSTNQRWGQIKYHLYLNTIFEYLYLYLKVTCYEYLYLYLNISEVFQKHQILQNTFKYNVLDTHDRS